MTVVRTERVDDLAVIHLDRPPVQAMDLSLLNDLIVALQAFTESDARAAILTASGRTFCAGVDLRILATEGPAYIQEFLPLLSQAFATLFTVPKPVIAAVNGHALAGGCILTAACDQRLMADGPGLIGATEVVVGVPFPSWALEIVRFSTPPQHVQTVLLTGRAFSAEEGLRLGLLDEVVAPDQLMERAMAVARELGSVPEATFAHTKRQLRQPTINRVERHGPDFDALAEAMWASPETQNHVRAFLAARVGKS